MDGTVLADLERRQMEAERRELPAQLVVESVRPVVGAGSRTGVAGQHRARTTQPLGDEPEPLAVWLVRKATAKLTVCLGQLFSVTGETRGQRLRDPLMGRRRGLGL